MDHPNSHRMYVPPISRGACARFKVENQLENWRKDNTFSVKGFEQGLLVGRLL